MEEDAGVKAPVTRLRRRLSVEQSEENKSPALNTPTKKRGGRRAKPELELIDENTPENTTKTNKKTATKEIKHAVEEKPVTPSRHSTRIKSNTSIVSDTALNVDSPRAKRAARRTSAVGSDSETRLTPVRQTRRTRKDSVSSLDKAEIPASKPAPHITEIIVEESETNERKLISNADKDNSISPNNVRKSPRLAEKNKKNSPVKEDHQNETSPEKQYENMPSRKSIDLCLPNSQQTNNDSQKDPPTDNNETKSRLSISSANLIKDLEVKVSTILKDNLNKTISSINDKNKVDERQRTKSWTTLTLENESNFYSDNENSKKNIIKDPEQSLKSDSGDTSNNKSMQDESLSKRKNSNSGSFIVEDIDVSGNNNQNKSQINEVSATINNKSNNDGYKLFKKGTSSNVQTLILVGEDSDSNHGKHIQNMCESGDQCVPVVENTIQEKEKLTLLSNNQSVLNDKEDKSGVNLSCEPMDVDETIHESIIVETENSEESSSNRNSVAHFQVLDKSNNGEKLNKSKRKSSISNNLEKSGNENKSTLILSQLKDASSNEISNVVKSPQFKNEILSKTIEDLNVTQENEITKKNISLNCVTTSTPLQQKNLQKLALNANTSIISANDSKNLKENVNLPKNNENLISSDENDSDKEDNPDIKEISIKSEKRNQSKLNVSGGKELNAETKVADEKNSTKNKSLNSSKKNVSQKQNDLNTDTESDEEYLNIKRKIKLSKPSQFQTSAETDESDDNENDESINNENDESDDNSNLLDDKASDAGDDYQSGDSQTEDEREYVRENEILEKGETLTSEEEFSVDSDYEKDSFVVSSAEEDNELLDGTEDDLTMSDNELKMTAQSKKKYNERKKKEQKEASKDMFDSRHKLNTNKSSSSELGKTKRNKKQQLRSSESDSESEPKLRKNNRMRLDSTNEAIMLEDDVDKKSKKTKRNSASECEDSIVSEKEITIANQSIKETDPLATIQVKEEPKTPKKENASITFINSDEMHMDVDTNEMTKTQTEIDPLDASEDDDENISLSSDTEIMQNYDSMLESLSKNNKNKTKTVDISLNLDKKTRKEKMPIFDELNLTQVKTTKKIKTRKEIVESKVKDQEDDGSSDSIDLHLLFSEDSNNSEDVKQKDDKEQIIQLKRKDGKMDIRDINNDTSIQANNTSLNVSQVKKNKKRNSKIDDNISTIEAEETNVSFFIDTEGTHTSQNVSVNKNIKTEEKKYVQYNDGNNSDEAPIEVSFQKANKNIDIDTNGEDETDYVLEKSINKSIVKTPGSEKKKKKNKKLQAEQIDDGNIADKSLNISLGGNKKSKSTCEIQPIETEHENVKNISLDTSVSKNKSKSLIKDKDNGTSEEDSDVQATNVTLIETPSSQKKKSRISENYNTLNVYDSGVIMNNSFGKKRNTSLNVEEQNETNKEDIPESSVVNIPVVKTPGSQKNTKHCSESQSEVNDVFEVLVNKFVPNTPNSGKKKKKHSNSINDDLELASEDLDVSTIKTPGSQKKKSSQSQLESVQVSLDTSKIKTPGSQKKITQEIRKNKAQVDIPEVKEASSNKRKRKASLNKTVEELNCKDGENNVSKTSNESVVGSQKKKLRISQNSQENIKVVENQQKEHNLQSFGDKKKKKIKKQDTFNFNTEIEIPDMAKANRSKRKQREDDDDANTASKVLKQNSFDKKVLRLPASILNQLDDNPKKKIRIPKKAKAVSTSQFLVEEAVKRKNKPSNYLEESIYLNDGESVSRKVKKNLQKPKVLPFVPTASTSGSGYTTDFKVNIIPRETKFIAQTSNISNFKEDYISNKKIKRQGTYELYKRNRNIKISKF